MTEHTAESDVPRVRRFLLRLARVAAREQARRDLVCWQRGHRGDPCRRCGRRVTPPEGGKP